MGSNPLVKVPVRLTVSVDFDLESEARTVSEALRVDDDDFITTDLDGCKVLARVESDSIEGARRAADDWLACLMSVIRERSSDRCQ